MISLLAVIERDTLLYTMVKKKGYVRMHTNFGDLNFELHCDLAPKTCCNFITHCRNGYYTDTGEGSRFKVHTASTYCLLQCFIAPSKTSWYVCRVCVCVCVCECLSDTGG